jgi:hypothetical protein
MAASRIINRISVKPKVSTNVANNSPAPAIIGPIIGMMLIMLNKNPKAIVKGARIKLLKDKSIR